jgi:hypothetical protein
VKFQEVLNSGAAAARRKNDEKINQNSKDPRANQIKLFFLRMPLKVEQKSGIHGIGRYLIR